jgi:hypothetical protein
MMDIEQIRVRIMSEAYDLADRGDSEGYNAIKVMCSDVLELIGKQWVGLTDEDMEALFLNEDGVRFARYIEAKLREKNHG